MISLDNPHLVIQSGVKETHLTSILFNYGKFNQLFDSSAKNGGKNRVGIANKHIDQMLKFREEQLRPFMIACCPIGDAYREKHLKVFRDDQFQTLFELFQKMLNTQIGYYT